MDAKIKMIVSAGLTFSFIGFVLYLLIILTGFLSCCIGITLSGFDQLLIILAAASLAAFGVCFYTSCYRKWRKAKKSEL